MENQDANQYRHDQTNDIQPELSIRYEFSPPPSNILVPNQLRQVQHHHQDTSCWSETSGTIVMDSNSRHSSQNETISDSRAMSLFHPFHQVRTQDTDQIDLVQQDTLLDMNHIASLYATIQSSLALINGQNDFQASFQSHQPPQRSLSPCSQNGDSIRNTFEASPFQSPRHIIGLASSIEPPANAGTGAFPTRATSEQLQEAVPVRAHSKKLGSDRYRSLSRKQQFLVFVKVLMKILQRSNEHVMLRNTKTIVAMCTVRNRSGDKAYTPLQDAISVRLRREVGEVYWSQATNVFNGRI